MHSARKYIHTGSENAIKVSLVNIATKKAHAPIHYLLSCPLVCHQTQNVSNNIIARTKTLPCICFRRTAFLSLLFTLVLLRMNFIKCPIKIKSFLVVLSIIWYNIFRRYFTYQKQKEAVMEQFLTDDDLFGLLEELEQEEAEIEIMEDEMEASSRRFEEIIKKHKND